MNMAKSFADPISPCSRGSRKPFTAADMQAILRDPPDPEALARLSAAVNARDTRTYRDGERADVAGRAGGADYGRRRD